MHLGHLFFAFCGLIQIDLLFSGGLLAGTKVTKRFSEV